MQLDHHCSNVVKFERVDFIEITQEETFTPLGERHLLVAFKYDWVFDAVSDFIVSEPLDLEED